MDKGVKGPDFPLGGKIIADRAALRKIYEDGEGSIKVQAEWKLEKADSKVPQIVITSIPYGVEKEKIENDIGAIVEDRKLSNNVEAIFSVEQRYSDPKQSVRLIVYILLRVFG